MANTTTTTGTEVVTVIFRVWNGREGGEVLALFPDLPADTAGRLCTCFAHVGQHSGADYQHCIRESRPATEAEYAELKRELEAAPYHYRLKVQQRRRRQR